VTHAHDGAETGADPATLATTPTEPTTPADGEPGLSSVRTVQYKGGELDAERGPGLGCFRFQLVVLVVLLIVTPLGVNAGWPDWLTAVLLFTTLALLLVAGQTVIFLLRLVAADRRGRRRPLASPTPTVGELDDTAAEPEAEPEREPVDDAGDPGPSVRQ
jgi:hypothetical protein